MRMSAQELKRELTRVLATGLRRRSRYRQVIWMVGDARSGSSWAAEMLASICGYRQMFEPFHPIEVAKFSGYALNHFQRRGSENDVLQAKLDDVFSGRVHNLRVNQAADRFFCSGLLVKDVFATLIAAWAQERFPHVQLVVPMRNPLAVAVSKARKSRSRWTSGPAELLEQRALVEAHLKPHVAFLRHIDVRDDPLLKHVAVWAIIHSSLFHDLDARKVQIVHYRRMLEKPEREISRLLERLGITEFRELSSDMVTRIARYSDSSSVTAVRGSRDRAWLKEFSTEQRRCADEILRRFGVDELYDGGEPVRGFQEEAAKLCDRNAKLPIPPPVRRTEALDAVHS